MTVSDKKTTKARLKFKKELISTLGTPISTKELLARLQALVDELSATQQEEVELESYGKVKKELVDKKLLKHNNAGVQALTCCGLSDILRIYAPDAPFTASELSLVFRAFFNQLRKLSDPENPYFQQQCYLLKRLAEVRSVILITDLPDSEQLIESMFEMFYNLSVQSFPARLEPLVSEILSEVISECDTVPQNVLKLILNRFLTNHGSLSLITSGQKSNITNPGFNFSVSICEANLDRMSRHVAQFFSEMLYDSSTHTKRNADDSSTSSRGNGKDLVKEAKALETLRKIHKLSIEIWVVLPELLSSVMGLIDDELNANDEKIRILATETIGKMIGSSGESAGVSKVNFIVAHKQTWLNWLKKTLDISPNVRCKWVEQLSIIANSSNSSTSEIKSELASGLTKCLLDTNERVRLSACLSIQKIQFENFTSKLCNKNIMNTLFQLIREKYAEIRNEVIKVLGTLYNRYWEEGPETVDFGNNDNEGNEEMRTAFEQGIPNNIISLIYINDNNINSAVDMCIFEKLLPFETNTIKRVERLTRIYSNLNEKSKKSFLAINKRQQQISKVLLTFCDIAEEYAITRSVTDTNEDKENVISELEKSTLTKDRQDILVKMDKIVNWLCVSFPDGLNTYACLERFFKLKVHRFFHLIRICVSPESDFSTVKNSMKELLNKLTNSKTIRLESERNTVSTTDMVSNMKLLLYRSSMILYNKSNMMELINHSKDPKNKWYSVTNEILDNVSVSVPEVLKFHFDNLIEAVSNHDSSTDDVHGDKSSHLKLVYHFLKKFSSSFPKDPEFANILRLFSIEGTADEAKYAVKLIGLCPIKELLTQEIFKVIYPLDQAHEKFATHLSTISEFFIVNYAVVEPNASDITTFLIKNVLLQNREVAADISETEWIDDKLIKDHAALHEKLIALRVFANRLRSFEKRRQYSSNDVVDVAQPIFKLFFSLIVNGGEIVSKNNTLITPKTYQQRLRLGAGTILIKLAKFPFLNEIFQSQKLNKLVYLLQDECEDVRRRFLANLKKEIASESISERFLPLVFFMAHEPEATLKYDSTIWLKSMFKRQDASSSMKFEKTLVRLIHMVCHSEVLVDKMKDASSENDINVQQEKYTKAYLHASEYIMFFTTCIAKAENNSLLYYLASRVKQYRDATIDPDLYESEPHPLEVLGLYRIAELTQLIIKEICDTKGWNLQTWPGKIQLPSDLFSPMTSTKEAHDIVTTVYIPDKIQARLKVLIRQRLFLGSQKRKQKSSGSASRPKKSKMVAAEGRSKVKHPKRSKSSKENELPSRKSHRAKKQVAYAEESGSESVSEANDESDSE